MRIEAVELIRAALPFKQEFRSALGAQRRRDVLLVHVITDAADGWGECAAMSRPVYTSEYVDGAQAVLRDHLVPLALADSSVDAQSLERRLSEVRGHRMARAALEMAALDAELRTEGVSLAAFLGGERDEIPCGAVLGVADTIDALLDDVEQRLREGYRRIKLKILPGWDLEPVAAVRGRFGAAAVLWLDANGAYALEDAPRLATLAEHDVALIEEPLGGRSLLAHAELARVITTPVCLDESIESAHEAADALTLGACSIVNVKPGRVGGLLEARRVHEVCLRRGASAWCGGMFETGIGRAANLALASLPGFTLAADISPSGRYFDLDLTMPPTVMQEGMIRVPDAPGLGVTVDRAAIDTVAVDAVLIRG